jgi:hypothetical protein
MTHCYSVNFPVELKGGGSDMQQQIQGSHRDLTKYCMLPVAVLKGRGLQEVCPGTITVLQNA